MHSQAQDKTPEALASALRDRYRIHGPVGRGGMAVVYLADDLKHARPVALKVLRPEVADAIGRDRFLREIAYAARLTHPHILPLHDSGAAGDLLFYVTPYIDGETLRARLAREGRLPLDVALALTREIASALGHAHRRGLVHRDVKPENVLLADGVALVADFGIARPVSPSPAEPGAETRATTEAGWIGTPRYMSPEQADGVDLDARSDLYSLACVLYEMLAGEAPFSAPTASGMLQKHRSEPPRPLREHAPSVPEAVATVVARGLAKHPDERYPTAARFAEALATAASGAGTPEETAAESARERPRGNFPGERTPFIGRAREIAECARLLAETRLLTITGIGGSGKTRLARKVAEAAHREFPDGVWLVDLAPVTERDRVGEAAAAALGVPESPGRTPVEAVVRHVASRRLLLLLDNCEHLIDSCAALADAVLAGAEEARILATSREGLGVEGERLVALRSLPVPDRDAVDPGTVEASDAARLFADRARAAAGEFRIDATNAAAVAEICRRLDGIPLAIELAAARVKILSVEQIRTRLDDRFRLLTGSRSAIPRHQTLRAVIQWSWDQLGAAEQELLRSLAVFAGGCTLEAAAAVAGEDTDEFEVMDLLGRLVDRSLVRVEREEDVDARYSLLETVRQYARERLEEGGAFELAQERHAAFYRGLAERAYPERIARESSWAAVLEREHDNLRLALGHARRDAERHLELAGALAWFWLSRSHLHEGRAQLTSATAAAPVAPPRRARARALWGAAIVTGWQGNPEAAVAGMEAAIDIWRALGADEEIAPALEGVGWMEILCGREERARAVLEECLRLHRERGDPVGINRAMVALTQALVALRETGDARALVGPIIEYSAANHDLRSEHFGWHFLADCALIEGRCDESLGHYGMSLELARAMGDRLEMSFEIQGVAMSLAGLGRHEAALCLAAAAAAEYERIGADIHLRFWDALLRQYLGPARRALDATDLERIESEGRALRLEEAIEESLAAAGRSGTGGGPAGRAAGDASAS